jgi:hypothetical protein
MKGETQRQTPNYPPRGLRADDAASYLGMGRSKFLELVEDGRLQKPRAIDGMRVWDRLALDAAFNDFPDRSYGDDADAPETSTI